MQRKVRLQNTVQLLVGLLILVLPLFVFFGQNEQDTLSFAKLLNYIGFCGLFIAIYFLHSKFIFPSFFLHKRYTLYSATLLILLCCIILIRPFDRFIAGPSPMPPMDAPRHFPPNDFPPPPPNGNRPPFIDIVSVFLFILAISIGIATETSKQLRLTLQRALMAETEKAQAELAFLKAQVNPHFLFNILNNIYTLALTKDGNTAPSIMKLSNMMRYLTDEAGNDEVSLTQEVECMSDYIDLQRLRLTQKTTVEYQLTGDISEKKIAPLVLMAFVENVFKYGVSNHKASKLIIKLVAEQNFINLYCENTINQSRKAEKRKGIGLENTKKRLAYIYPNRHILEVENDQQTFKVNLTIHIA